MTTLQAYDKTGKRVNPDDTVTYDDGTTAKLEAVTRPTYPGKSGKVVVTGRMGELYASVVGLVVLDRTWSAQAFAELCEDYGQHMPDGYAMAIADIAPKFVLT